MRFVLSSVMSMVFVQRIHLKTLSDEILKDVYRRKDISILAFRVLYDVGLQILVTGYDEVKEIER